MSAHRLLRRSLLLTAGALPLTLIASSSHADVLCRSVRGEYTEHAVSTGCTSPVGLCLAAEYKGAIHGPSESRVTTLVPTADTAATAVALFTADSHIDARVRGRSGTLLIKNAGAFRGAGEGSIVDLQTIVGGTGELAGASGDLRAQGVFTPATGGESDYEGMLCLP
jgi:Protein of unknown function (DUF3224)